MVFGIGLCNVLCFVVEVGCCFFDDGMDGVVIFDGFVEVFEVDYVDSFVLGIVVSVSVKGLI